MKEIKYYHLRRNLTDEKPLDFVSLDNAYDFLVGFFTDKKAKVWHCDGIEDSAEPTPKEWVKAVMEELGVIEFEIITGDDEHYDLWLSEKELRFADDGIAGAFAPKATPIIKLHKAGERVLILLNGKAVCETPLDAWKKQDCSVIDELRKIIVLLPAEQGGYLIEQGITGNFDFPGLRDFIFREMLIEYTVEKTPVKEDPNKDIFEYWKKLSQTGDAEAQNNLALMYYGGNGTEKDEELALKYFQLAAEQGHADAQENFRLLKEAIAAEKVLNKRSQNKE